MCSKIFKIISLPLELISQQITHIQVSEITTSAAEGRLGWSEPSRCCRTGGASRWKRRGGQRGQRPAVRGNDLSEDDPASLAGPKVVPGHADFISSLRSPILTREIYTSAFAFPLHIENTLDPGFSVRTKAPPGMVSSANESKLPIDATVHSSAKPSGKPQMAPEKIAGFAIDLTGPFR